MNKKMKILCVYGQSRISGIANALEKMKKEYEIYPVKQVDVFENENSVTALMQYIEEHGITHLLTIDLIDNVAAAASRTGIKYVSIIWDAPYHKLFSAYGRMPVCWFSTFDRLDCRKFQERGLRHVCYQPLSVDDIAIRQWDREYDAAVACGKRNRYINDICFVGNLYDENFYDEFCQNIPQTLQDYFTDIFEKAAFHWDGINRISGTVSDEMIAYIRETTPDFQMVNFFDIKDTELFENGYLIRKTGNIERICVLNILAEQYDVTLYTTSKNAAEKLVNVKVMPPVCSGKDAHYVFRESKINLNISLKGIEEGTPLRVMDIMGAGGFVLTNYCPETADLFEDGKEIVMFKTPEELMEKADYYLRHDKEREEIAAAGKAKVLECYTYEKKLKELLAWVEEEKECSGEM